MATPIPAGSKWHEVVSGSFSRWEGGKKKDGGILVTYEAGERVLLNPIEAETHKRHMKIADAPAIDPLAAKGGVTGREWSSLLGSNAMSIVSMILEMDDLVDLTEISAAETNGKNRRTVLNAIEERLDKLTRSAADEKK